MSRPGTDASLALDRLLVGAFYAYRQGLSRQPSAQLPMPPRDFDTLKFLGTLGSVPLRDRLELHRLHIACSKGLAAGRQRRLDDATAHYWQAEMHLGFLQGSTRFAWLLGDSTYRA